MKKIIFKITIIMCLTSIAYAGNTRLYKQYVFGMSRKEIKQDKKVYDCSKSFEQGALCKDREKFAGEDMAISFRFLNNKLVAVVLLPEFTNENYIKFSSALVSKFQLASIQNEQKKVDLLLQFKKNGKDMALKNIADVEQIGLSNGNIKYVFIDKNIFLKLAKTSSSIVDLTMKADRNMRVVEYVVFEDENTKYGLIQFAAPNRTRELMKIKQKYEDF